WASGSGRRPPSHPGGVSRNGLAPGHPTERFASQFPFGTEKERRARRLTKSQRPKPMLIVNPLDSPEAWARPPRQPLVVRSATGMSLWINRVLVCKGGKGKGKLAGISAHKRTK